jgi:hypothetical protein
VARYKYTPQLLAEAATESHSVAEVLRRLGIRWNGGAHAHISRQLKRLGIDTGHFTGSAHNRGAVGANRRTAEQLLVRLPVGSRRTPGFRLARALRQRGVPDRCTTCGLGPEWNGLPLTLHVDHHNGDFLDNRPDNLRLLCPNCHSQTATYAGRNRRPGDVAEDTDATIAALLRFHDGELTAEETAAELGCEAKDVPVMRMQALDGRSARYPRAARRAAQRRTVIAYALAHPDEGYRAIAAGLRTAPGGSVIVGHGRIRALLVAAGLNTPAARRDAARRDGAQGDMAEPDS